LRLFYNVKKAGEATLLCDACRDGEEGLLAIVGFGTLDVAQ
jgi:hypothetical protein